jgi:hypothetical protein
MSFSFKGTESSRSKHIMSAFNALAFSINRLLLLGTKIRLLSIIWTNENEEKD